MFRNRPGDVRTEGNTAAHEFSAEDQAAAVLSTPVGKRRKSLLKIFFFVHGRSAQSFMCVGDVESSWTELVDGWMSLLYATDGIIKTPHIGNHKPGHGPVIDIVM